MRWLLSSVTIVEPGSVLHGKKRDILIEDGHIVAIKSKISDDDAEKIQGKGMHVSSGWIDARVDLRDPGNEYKEGLENGLDAAAAGGFTHVVQISSTQPPIDHKGQIEYLLARSASHAVRLLPCGSISKGNQGKQLAELFDLDKAGAVGFTDGYAVERTALMLRALEYTKNFDGLVISIPLDADIQGEGQMHEGVTSTMNGLKGIPTLAETARVKRDIDLVRYTGGRLHFGLISSAESVKLIKEAKKEGLAITCGVSAQHLFFDDSDLANFESNLKVLPPLRTDKDKKALVKAVKDGVIDVICSDHHPEDIEHKKLEFLYATFGAAGIEQTFAAAMESGVDQDTCIKALTQNPREVFQLPETSISEGAFADLTLFFPEETQSISRSTQVSKGWNNPYLDQTLKGKIKGIIRGDRMVIAD